MASLRRSLFVAASAAAAFSTTHAHAQTSPGFAVDRFDASERGSEWFSTDSLDLRGDTRPAVGLVLDTAIRPLAVYKTDASGKATSDVLADVVKYQAIAHLGGSLVFADRFRVGVDVPLVLQDGSAGTQTRYAAPADSFTFGDLRLGADVRLAGEYGDPFTLAFGARAYLPTGKQSDYTGDESFRIEPRVEVAGDVDAFVYSARIGFQYRGHTADLDGGKIGSELPFAVAAGVRLADRKLVIGPEVFGTTVISEGDAFARKTTPLEGILGLHYTASDVRFGAGGGLGLTRGFGAPVARIVAMVEWAPAYVAPKPIVVDRDGDGVVDEVDACPAVKGVATDDKATNGCPADRDRDGIIDVDDACPDVKGVPTKDPKTNGCPPDADGDGIPDSVDECTDTPGVKSDDPKKNGCPADRDNDTVLDKDDACPDVAGLSSADPKLNGCPDPDRDKDNIPNDQDACPDEAGKADPDPKRNGCPKAFVKEGQIKILDQVKFKTGSADILPGKDSEEVLHAVLDVLTKHPEIKKVRVEGHTDNRGGKATNTKLSAARAASVVKWLVKNGVDKDRLASEGFGPDRPIDDNSTDAGRQNNRRVEFHIEGAPAASQ